VPPLYSDDESVGADYNGTVAANQGLQHLSKMCERHDTFNRAPGNLTHDQRVLVNRVAQFSSGVAGTQLDKSVWQCVTVVCDWLQKANRPQIAAAFLKGCGLSQNKPYLVAQAGHELAASQ
jgi:hypothetical protein